MSGWGGAGIHVAMALLLSSGAAAAAVHLYDELSRLERMT